MTDAPIGADEADRIFASLAACRVIAIAVSGGPDSLALMHLLVEWASRRSQAPDLYILTVDHGLRPGSAVEAAGVAKAAAALNLPARILTWQDDKPATGIQARARDARFKLLTDAARAHGADVLVLAHTRDDQVETFLARLARGSGLGGLAAIRPMRCAGGLTLARPLLGIAKTRLIATLAERSLTPFEDPSNSDRHFERVRWRQAMPLVEAAGLSPSRIVESARRLARAADALDHYTHLALRAHTVRHPAGPVAMPLMALAALPEETRLRCLTRLIRAVAPATYGPRVMALERAWRLVGAGMMPKADDKRPALNSTTTMLAPRSITLGGAALTPRDDGWLIVYREVGRTSPADVHLCPGEETVWLDRWRIALDPDADRAVTITPLARAPGGIPSTARCQGAFASCVVHTAEAPPRWPRAAFSMSPAIVVNDATIWRPGFDDGDNIGKLGIVFGPLETTWD